MSYFEDVEADCIYDIDELYERCYLEAESGYWTMKNGESIHISHMSSNHLRNCINMIRRNDDIDMMWHWVEVMEAELEKRNVALRVARQVRKNEIRS